ncbi:hypothetical protein I3760_03G119500 [Carya illinoinensis]|nr:hypothetical protein I3760_03G119500 [Carya illinoinensis]
MKQDKHLTCMQHKLTHAKSKQTHLDITCTQLDPQQYSCKTHAHAEQEESFGCAHMQNTCRTESRRRICSTSHGQQLTLAAAHVQQQKNLSTQQTITLKEKHLDSIRRRSFGSYHAAGQQKKKKEKKKKQKLKETHAGTENTWGPLGRAVQ